MLNIDAKKSLNSLKTFAHSLQQPTLRNKLNSLKSPLGTISEEYKNVELEILSFQHRGSLITNLRKNLV